MRIIPSLCWAGALVGAGYVARQHMGEWSFAPWWPWCYLAAGAVLLVLVLDHLRWTGSTLAGLGGLAGVTVGVWFASGDVPAATPGAGYWPLLLLGGGLLLFGTVAARLRGKGRLGIGGRVRRWAARGHRRNGFASRTTILRVASRLAMRRKAKILRPSLAQVSWWRRWFATGTREFATAIARVGALRIWSSVEEVTLRVGGPRTGKTGELAGRILDAPGAVITTSTRTDLVELTSQLRETKHGPTGVFNPSGLGSLESTVTFDPLSGCETPKTAVHRAEDLMSGVSVPGSGGEHEFWSAQAKRTLAALLHAAALSGASMYTVMSWVSNPGKAEHRKQVQTALRRSPEPAFELDAMQFLDTNERSRSSVCMTIMPALQWLTDPTAVAATQGGTFDVAQLLEARGTLYLLGAEDGLTAPLVTALTAHIAREARRIAADQASGRLDPPLTLALDEAALICPVPLDRWSADMGGRGVAIHVAVQGRSQLQQRWGTQGASTILNNTATLLVYGATKDHDDLQAYSALTDQRWEMVPAIGAERAPAPQKTPAMSPAQISQLRFGRALIVRRGMPATVGRVQMAWQRHDHKTHRRNQRLAALRARLDHHTARLGTTTAGVKATVGPRLAAAGQRLRPRRTQEANQAAYQAVQDTVPQPVPDAVQEAVPVEYQPVAPYDGLTGQHANSPAAGGHGPGAYRAGTNAGGAPEAVTRIHPEPEQTSHHNRDSSNQQDQQHGGQQS